jgi:hypothetical protein
VRQSVNIIIHSCIAPKYTHNFLLVQQTNKQRNHLQISVSHKSQQTHSNTMSQLQRDEGAFSASESDDSFDESDIESTSGQHEGDAKMDTTQKDQVKEVEEMAKRETRNMRAWKAVVCITILAIATLVSAGTWIFLKSEEDSNYEDSYYEFANTIRNSVRVHKRDLFLTMRGCSDSISGVAIASNSQFPFVTVPTFEILGHSVRQQSGAEVLIFTPKVEADELASWQEYATANEEWYEESKQLAVSSSESSSVVSDFVPGNISAFIYDPSEDEEGENLIPANPPFYPIWQFSPPPFSPFALKANFAQLMDFGGYLKTVDIVREGVLGETFDERTLKQADHAAYHAQFLVSSDVESSAFKRPHAFFFQPVFREPFNDASEIVGTVNAMLPWDRYFANLLPEGIKGITGVLKNTCGQSFTYYLDGNKVRCAPFNYERGLMKILGTTLTLFPIFFSAGVLCWRGRPAR